MTASTALDPRNYGAAGDGRAIDTQGIQAAIDACAAQGGGTVHIPPGVFLIGTIFLKTNVRLHLDNGAELHAAQSLDHFPRLEPSFVSNFNPIFAHALIYADSQHNISLTGGGTIHGHGTAFRPTTMKKPEHYFSRPGLVRFVNCTAVRIDRIHLRDAAFWTLHLLACDNCVIDGITIRSRGANYNNDGIDVDCCDDVRIANCSINTGDDAISFKGTGDRPLRRIVVINCTLSSNFNAIRVGAECFGGFEDILVANCCVNDSGGGVTFQCSDGAFMRRIQIRGLTLHRVAEPFFIMVGTGTYPTGLEDTYPCPPKNAPGTIEDIVFADIIGTELGRYQGTGPVGDPAERNELHACIFSGHAQAPLRNITLRGVDLRFVGGGTNEHLRNRLEQINQRFTSTGQPPTPAYGLLARNVENLTLHDLRLAVERPDQRPAIAVEYAAGVVLDGVRAELADDQPAVVRTYDAEPPRLTGGSVRRGSGRCEPLDPATHLAASDTAFSSEQD